MFLHIGNNYMLKLDEIIGIFNVSALQEDTKGRRFLNETRQRDNVVDISDGKESTLVLTDDTVYVTRISSTTLLSRSRDDDRDTFSSARQPNGAATAQAGESGDPSGK